MCLLAPIGLIFIGAVVYAVGSALGEEAFGAGTATGIVAVVLFTLAALVHGVISHFDEQDRKDRAAQRRLANDRRRPSSAAWRRAREAALQRDGYRCVQCGHAAEEVDHIVPRAMGGSVYDLNNLQSMCKPCHKRKTAQQAGEIRRYMRGE